MRRWTMLVLAVGIAGCSEKDRLPGIGRIVESIDLGRVLSADEVPTSNNDWTRTRIDCERGTFFVRGVRSILKGKTAKVERFEDGSRCLFVQGEDRGWVVR